MLFLSCALAIQGAEPSRAEDRPSYTDRSAAFIAEAAPRFNIPAHRICNIMHIESVDDSRTVSHAGAMELMQIMPATGRSCARVAVLAAMPSVRATTFSRAFPISANAMTAMDRRGFSRPIMRDRGAIEGIWQAGPCRAKRALASPNARLFPVAAITVKQSAGGG
jgi:soluble lytic murein transglycosylase-like protein